MCIFIYRHVERRKNAGQSENFTDRLNRYFCLHNTSRPTASLFCSDSQKVKIKNMLIRFAFRIEMSELCGTDMGKPYGFPIFIAFSESEK